MAYVILFIPVFLIIGAATLFWWGLRKPLKQGWLAILLGIFILILLAIGIAILEDFFALIIGIVAVITSLILGLVVALLLSKKRKWAVLIFGVLFPIMLGASIMYSFAHSTNAIRRKNAQIIIKSLEEYRSNYGDYPDELDQIIPTYLEQLPEIETVWGWLYTVSEDTFSLGYVSYVDGWSGYSVCFYTSSMEVWDCLMSTGPFVLPAATPSP